jgi:hypothetical protein
MKKLRTQLMETQAWLEARLKGQKLPKPAGLITPLGAGQGTQFVGTLHHRQLGDQHLHIFKE